MSKRRTHSYHTKQLERILKSKSVQAELGIEGVIWGATEVPFWKNNKIDVYCEVDVLLYTGEKYVNPFYVIEYKSGRRSSKTVWKKFLEQEGYKTKVRDQLLKAEKFVNENFQQACYKLFVWGDFEYHYFGKTPRRQG